MSFWNKISNYVTIALNVILMTVYHCGYLLSSKLKEQTEEILSVAMIERAYSDDTANHLGWHEL